MIVLDASTLVSAALKADDVPERALLRAEEIDVLAHSVAIDAEIALASAAETIVSSDSDLLVLHLWRGVRILDPADYLRLS